MKRRQFIMALAAGSALATPAKVVFAQGDASNGKQNALIFLLKRTLPRNAMENMKRSLESVAEATGCKIIVMSERECDVWRIADDGTFAHVMHQASGNGKSQFVSVASDGIGHELRLKETGEIVSDRVKWCETRSGIACIASNNRMEESIVCYRGGLAVTRVHCQSSVLDGGH